MAIEQRKIVEIADTADNILNNMNANQQAFSTTTKQDINVNAGTQISRTGTDFYVGAVQYKVDGTTKAGVPQDNQFGTNTVTKVKQRSYADPVDDVDYAPKKYVDDQIVGDNGGTLIKVTESAQIGHVLRGDNRANKGNIGNNAVDFSTHSSASTTHGATGGGSFAEGVSNVASGTTSHVEGEQNTSSAYGTHAEGVGTTASADGAHSEGSGTTASGLSAHAEGQNTSALGHSSHSEGEGTTATPVASHSEGYHNTIDGNAPTGAHVEGKYANTVGANKQSVIGIGEGSGNRKDGRILYTDGTMELPNATSELNGARGDKSVVILEQLAPLLTKTQANTLYADKATTQTELDKTYKKDGSEALTGDMDAGEYSIRNINLLTAKNLISRIASMPFSATEQIVEHLFIGNPNPDTSVFGDRVHAYVWQMVGNNDGYDYKLIAKTRDSGGGAGADKEILAVDQNGVVSSSDASIAELLAGGVKSLITKEFGDDQYSNKALLASHTGDATIHRSINDTGTSATDLWSAEKIASSSGQLEKITEGGSTGYALRGNDRTAKADIGEGAIDLSENDYSEGNATGALSFVTGTQNNGSGNVSFVGGGGNSATGSFSVAFGENNLSTSGFTFVGGTDNEASNFAATAFGNGNTVSGYSSFAVNSYNTVGNNYGSSFGIGNKILATAPDGAHAEGIYCNDVGADKQSVIGIGTGGGTRKDGRIMWTDGTMTLPEATTVKTKARGDKAILTWQDLQDFANINGLTMP